MSIRLYLRELKLGLTADSKQTNRNHKHFLIMFETVKKKIVHVKVLLDEKKMSFQIQRISMLSYGTWGVAWKARAFLVSDLERL